VRQLHRPRLTVRTGSSNSLHRSPGLLLLPRLPPSGRALCARAEWRALGRADLSCPHRQDRIAVPNDHFHHRAGDAQLHQHRPGSVLAGLTKLVPAR
jgi:hypothetical protein